MSQNPSPAVKRKPIDTHIQPKKARTGNSAEKDTENSSGGEDPSVLALRDTTTRASIINNLKLATPSAATLASGSTSMGDRTKILNSSGGSGSASGKKLVIKAFEKKPQLPANFEEDTWKKLAAAVTAIQQQQAVASSLEELYKACEDLCTHRLAAALYARLAAALHEHVAHEAGRLRTRMAAVDAEAFLPWLNAAWNAHCQGTLLVRSIFLYLDRTYVIQTAGTKSIWDLALAQFRELVLGDDELAQKLVQGLLALIERERTAEAVDRTLLKNLLRMLSALGAYSSLFERRFLDATAGFYAREAAARLQRDELPEYLAHAESRLHEEAERVQLYLEAGTRRPLVAAVERELLGAHVPALLDKGFAALMDQQRLPDLARLYNLLARVQALDKLKHNWVLYVKGSGVALVSDPERDKTQVEELLDLKARLDRVLHEAFHSSEALASGLKEALEHVINSRPNKPAELMAKFLDELLRAGSKRASGSDELEALIDRVMTLFRFIQGKDVFEAFYKKDLAKRLLLGKSVSVDAERGVISRLKTECGSNFTNKLEGMFKDIDLSKELLQAFRASPLAARLPREIDMGVHVLTTGYWPPYAPTDVRLPASLADCMTTFREFYLSKHSGRRLMWIHSLAQCTLKAQFAKTRKELSLSLFQALTLLTFTGPEGAAAPTLALTDLAAATNLDDKELRRTLLSLACGKVKLLKKEPKTREIGDADTFTVNDEFTHKLYRIKVNAVQVRETVEEQTKTTEAVFADRQYQVDAAIVRIMKTRKSLPHTQLISELYAQLKFPLKPADLKKRVESLIEREYLERDPNNPNLYNYLA